MASEGTDMNKPSWFSNNLTLGNVITLGVLMCTGVYGYAQLTESVNGKFGQLTQRIENIEQFRVERVRNTDSKFSEIARSLESLPNLTYRVTATEEALKGTNARVDLSLANISQRLAEINQALGALDTKVAVLTQRIETNASAQRRADAARP